MNNDINYDEILGDSIQAMFEEAVPSLSAKYRAHANKNGTADALKELRNSAEELLGELKARNAATAARIRNRQRQIIRQQARPTSLSELFVGLAAIKYFFKG